MARLIAAALLLPAAAGVTVEILYGPYCPNSANYLASNMPALFDSGLDVQLTVLPYVLDKNYGGMPDITGPMCKVEGMPCHYLPAPLCALQPLAMPTPLSSVQSAVNFAVCDLLHANPSAPQEFRHRPRDIQQCAEQAGLDFGPVQACMQQPVPTQAYLTKIMELDAKLPSGMVAPFMWVDGEYVDTMQAPDLMEEVCNRLPAETPACVQKKAATKYAVSADGQGFSFGDKASPLLLVAVLVFALTVGVGSVCRRRRAGARGLESMSLMAPKEGSQVMI